MPTPENLPALRARYAAVSFAAIGVSDAHLIWLQRDSSPMQPVDSRVTPLPQLLWREAQRVMASRSMRS